MFGDAIRCIIVMQSMKHDETKNEQGIRVQVARPGRELGNGVSLTKKPKSGSSTITTTKIVPTNAF